MTILPSPQVMSLSLTNNVHPEPDLREKLYPQAQALEATFLSNMLAQSGFSPMQGAFGGGIGEEQFHSFLRDIYASSMVGSGGIGLTEAIIRSLMEESGNV